MQYNFLNVGRRVGVVGLVGVKPNLEMFQKSSTPHILSVTGFSLQKTCFVQKYIWATVNLQIKITCILLSCWSFRKAHQHLKLASSRWNSFWPTHCISTLWMKTLQGSIPSSAPPSTSSCSLASSIPSDMPRQST